MTDRDRILKAVDRLADALAELAYTDRISSRPDIRMLLTPDEPTSTEVRHMHAVGLTPEMAELLAEAAERLIASRSVPQPPDPFNAQVFALAKPELAAEINNAFAGIDLTEITRAVLADPDPHNRMTVTRALDDMFGDIPQEAEDDE
jgi:hypothetical protein